MKLQEFRFTRDILITAVDEKEAFEIFQRDIDEEMLVQDAGDWTCEQVKKDVSCECDSCYKEISAEEYDENGGFCDDCK